MLYNSFCSLYSKLLHSDVLLIILYTFFAHNINNDTITECLYLLIPGRVEFKCWSVLRLKKEPDNSHDRHAVAVVKSGDTVVGHVPYNLAPLFSHFLAREFNKGSVYITGERTNQGAGYGLEVHACIYSLYGPKAFVDRFKQKVENLRGRGLLPRSIDH